MIINEYLISYISYYYYYYYYYYYHQINKQMRVKVVVLYNSIRMKEP